MALSDRLIDYANAVGADVKALYTGVTTAQARADEVHDQLYLETVNPNLVKNGYLETGDFSWWGRFTAIPTNWSIAQRDLASTSGSLLDMPTEYAVQMAPSVGDYIHYFAKSLNTVSKATYVEDGEELRLSAWVGGAGATTPSGRLTFTVHFTAADGTYIPGPVNSVVVNGYGYQRVDTVVTVPAGASVIRYLSVTQATGQVETIFLAGLALRRSDPVASAARDAAVAAQATADAASAASSEVVVSRPSVANLDADTVLSYSAGAGKVKVVANQHRVHFVDEGLTFIVKGTVETDFDRINANGVKLLYVPTDMRYDVRAFGAKGDNTGDDTTAIQAAVVRAENQTTYGTVTQPNMNNHNGATVYFPRGRYTSTAVRVRKSGVTICGESITNTMIQQPNGGQLFLLYADDQEGGGVLMNLSIHNLDLRGTFVNPTGASVAIEVGIVKHVYMHHVKIHGFYIDMWLKGVQAPMFIHNCNFFSGPAVTGNTGDAGGTAIRVGYTQLSGTSINRTYNLTDPDNGGAGYCHSILIFISDCEFRNGLDAKNVFFDIWSVDGLYVDNCHMINANDAFIIIDQKTSITPCANIKFSDCMFDGEAFGTERILNIPDKSWAAGNKTDVDAVFYNCKFNGCGAVGENPASLVTVYNPYVKGLTFDGCYFDKCTGDSWLAIYGGGGVLSIKNSRFYADTGYNPVAFITLYNPATQGEFWDLVSITGNVFAGPGATAGAARHINIAGPVGRVAITGNTGNKCPEGDGLVRDVKTAGQVIGAWNTHGNAMF